MFDIPKTYKEENANYITLPAIKRFIKTVGIPISLASPREALLDAIVQYGQQCPENEESVLYWIDETLKEGIRDIHLYYEVVQQDYITTLYSNPLFCDSNHFCEKSNDGKLTLTNIAIVDTSRGQKVEFYFCQKLYVFDRRPSGSGIKLIDFPVFAEYYLSANFLLVSAKPRSNLCRFEKGKLFDYERPPTIYVDQIIRNAYGQIVELLGINKQDRKATQESLRNSIFQLLNQYTRTPAEILEALHKNSEQMQQMAAIIKSICAVPLSQHNDVESDIYNTVEKYLSINWTEKEIFIRDRNAYPIKLHATDEEESKVEQTAALHDPLQTKAVFFDNKKMLYKNKACDGMWLMWKRAKAEYGLAEHFSVRIAAKDGICVFKFAEYTSKEDIDHVLFSIISHEGIDESTADTDH